MNKVAHGSHLLICKLSRLQAVMVGKKYMTTHYAQNS